MKVESHPEVILDRVTQAFVDAVTDTILDLQAAAPVGDDSHPGQFRDSIGALSIGMGDPLYGRAKSAVPRAGATHVQRAAGQTQLQTPSGSGHLVAVIGSPLPYGGAVVRGAFVKGRGPHMRAAFPDFGNIAAGFVDHMSERLSAAGT